MFEVRDHFEALELQTLVPYACLSKHSKGRRISEPPSVNRTCFQRDRDRIIHSKAFRRLKHKTQVFVATESDHYRSRLTHTLEVAQISRQLARMLKLNEDLAESIALAHDLGHTPFGHSGERELNRLMENHGGFEHNRQSLRVVDELEKKYPQFDGLNLSFEIREGLRKHSSPWDTPEEGEPAYVTLEAQVVNLSDEIAYNNHDLDDGLTSGILNDGNLTRDVTLWREAKAVVKKNHVGVEDQDLKYLINSYLISQLVLDVFTTTEQRIKEWGIQYCEDLQHIKKPITGFGKEMEEKNKELRKYLFSQFYSHPSIYRMNKKGQKMIRGLFEEFVDDTRLLPESYRNKVRRGEMKERVVADYIAGMTDTYAQKEFQTIFG